MSLVRVFDFLAHENKLQDSLFSIDSEAYIYQKGIENVGREEHVAICSN